MQKIVQLSFLLIFFPLCLFAQGKMAGKVIDKNSEETLPGAYVFIKNAAGETLSNTFTNGEGDFSVNKPTVKSFVLEITFIGYETFSKTIDTPFPDNLGVIEIEQEGELLDEFELKAQVLTGEVKGDTVSFNAEAFRTRPQASAEELVRKMPGVIISGGTIEVQGETVGRVLVDGEPFFGDNPAMAMQNIPVEVIDRIEFLDQRSDQAILTGFDDGETIKTINIITKKDKRGGVFGRVFAGYGTDNNYIAGGSVNFFNETQRATILGLSNNINQQNFSADDLTGAFGGEEQRGGGGRGNNNNALTTRERAGITTTNSLGGNFSDKFDDGKAKFTGSYFFNNSDNVLNRVSSRRYILPSDSLQLYNQISNSRNRRQNHRVDMRLDYDITEKHAIIWRPRLFYQKRESVNNLFAQNLFNPQTPINETENTTNSTNEYLSFDNDLTYRYKLNKPGRIISTSISTRLNNSDNDSRLISVTRNFQTSQMDSLIQNSRSISKAFNYEFEIEYTEPLSEKSQLRIEYEVGNDIGRDKREIFQRDMESTVFELDSTLSNEFENTYLQHELGLGYRYNSEKLRIYSSLDYEISLLNSDRLFPGFENTQRTFRNFVPRFVLNYDWNEKTNIRVDYRARTDAPSVRQLQEVIDNSNPIQISMGNAGLLQEYQHRLFTRIRKIDTETSKSFFMFISGSVTNNYLGNSTFVAQRDTLIQGDVLLRQGGQLNKPVNLDNNWDARTYMSWGFPISLIKSNLNLSTRASISNRPGLINNQLNINKNIGLGQGIGISSNISEDLDFNISTEGNYNIVRSSLQKNLENNFYSQSTRLDLYWNFAGGFFFSTNVNNQLYKGLGEEFDQSVWLMNADLGFRFPPNQKMELKLTVFDLLNQNTSINRNVTDVYIQDERTQVLRQFFMLTMTYNIRKFGGNTPGDI